MDRTRIIPVCRIGFFLALCCFMLYGSFHVLRNKEEEPYRNLHKLEDDTVDVLIMGSSHAHSGFYTNVFWREYGMATYVLSGSLQTMWDSYHALCDALTTQTPSVIVLDAFALSFDSENMSSAFREYNTRGLKWSKNKLDAILAAVPEEDLSGHLLGYPMYHNRYEDLSKEDFRKSLIHPDNKGTHFIMFQTPYEPPVEPQNAVIWNPMKKSELYYRKIIELTLEREIPLLVVVTPFRYTEEEFGKMLAAEKIAKEYDIPFLDCNRVSEEIGIDYALSTSDGTHLNFHGGPLFSRYVAGYLSEHYDIPDRRGEAGYESWERDAAILERKLYNRNARNSADLKSFLKLFRDETYMITLMLGGAGTDTDQKPAEYLKELGIEPVGEGGIRAVRGGVLQAVCLPGEEHYLEMGEHDYYFKSERNAETGAVTNTVLLDREPFPREPESNGLTISVYDTVLREEVVSAITWKDNGYNGWEWQD